MKNGIEAQPFFGAAFNTENPDTDCTSGTQVHADGTPAKHFPLFKGLAGDSGSGATLGSVNMIAKAKWLHELDTRRRLQGDTVWLKPVIKF